MGENSNKSSILFKINLAQRVLMRAVDREMKDTIGVSATQAAALFYLDQHEGCSHSDLSRELLQNKSATTTLVERMENNGLILKQQSQLDRRTSHLFLTEKGKRSCSKALPFVDKYEQELIGDFNEDDIDKLEKLLTKVIARFHSSRENYFYSNI